MSTSLPFRVLCAAVACALAATHAASAQTGTAEKKPQHPAVCAQGVRVYTSLADVPTPYDTLTMPPAPDVIRVTSPEEAEAADLDIRKRAGSVGANGIVVIDTETIEDGFRRVSRSVTAIFASADVARAQQACK